jgi:hypothetical protein
VEVVVVCSGVEKEGIGGNVVGSWGNVVIAVVPTILDDLAARRDEPEVVMSPC